MKKITKLIALMIVLVMVVSALTACSLIGINLGRYRDIVAFTVGNEEIKVGALLDAYTSNYYSNYTNVSNGSMTLDDVFESTMNSLYSTYSMIDSYKNSDDAKVYTSADNGYVDIADDMKYLNQAESEFVLSYVKYSIFTTLDKQVETYITSEIGDLGTLEVKADREFNRYEDMGEAETYAEKLYLDALDDEKVNEYFTDYYTSDFNMYALDVEKYIFTEATATAKVDEINERLAKYAEDNDEDAKTITAAEYIAFQEDAMKSVVKSVKDNNDMTMEEYQLSQVDSLIRSILTNKYTLMISGEIEGADLVENLKAEFASAQAAFNTTFNQNKDMYFSFMNALTKGLYIYDIPTEYANDFIFVKNLLIPFNEEQTAHLKNIATIVGGTTSDAYKLEREKIAAEIVAKDFNNDEAEVEGIFELNGDKVAIAATGALGTALSGDVTNEEFMNLMVQYNTDTAQHTAYYDYVVYVGGDESFAHNWVPEFVEAAEQAYAGGLGSYALAVSDFGVHVVYYSADVTEWSEFDGANIYDTTTNEYQHLITYYTTKLNALSAETSEKLDEDYRFGGKIVAKDGLGYVLKELGLEYDFEAAMTDDQHTCTKESRPDQQANPKVQEQKH